MKALEWFRAQDIMPDLVKVNYISTEELQGILYLTENGTDEIVKRQGRMTKEMRQKQAHLLSLNFNDGLEYLANHTETLRTPIIVSGNKYLVGFNGDDIRKFIPQSTRKIQLLDGKGFIDKNETNSVE